MSIAEERVGDVAIVAPRQRLDVASASSLEQAIQRGFAAGARHLLIDLAAVNYVSSLGLAACLKGAKLARAAGGRSALTGVSPGVAELFDVSGFTRLFDIHPDRHAALTALGSARVQPAKTVLAEREHALTLPEELLLLARLDDGSAEVDLPAQSLDYALAGAVLLELCLQRRIDCDLRQITVADPSPTGDSLLDPALAGLVTRPGLRGLRAWLTGLAQEAPALRERILDRLVDRRILKRAGHRLMWALGVRRYPLIDDREVREVKQHVLAVLASRELPDPRDVALIAVTDACAILDALIDMDAMLDLRPRIALIVRLDLIAREMALALADARETSSSHGPGLGLYDRPAHDPRGA